MKSNLEHSSMILPQRPMNTVICRNLSFFASEENLYLLLSSVIHGDYIQKIKIERSESDGRSLLHSFIEMTTSQAAYFLIQHLDGRLFMGRKLR
jgi:RNA recognition motif-containing protein